MIGLKVFLTLLFTLIESLSIVILAVVSLLAGCVWFGLHTYFMPFYNVSKSHVMSMWYYFDCRLPDYCLTAAGVSNFAFMFKCISKGRVSVSLLRLCVIRAACDHPPFCSHKMLQFVFLCVAFVDAVELR